MSIRDDIELMLLAETGDSLTAEAAGIAVDLAFDSLLQVIGLDPETFREQVREIEAAAAQAWEDDQ